nr:MAG TPA: hypothetical protein [Caudoviricetes sp.]
MNFYITLIFLKKFIPLFIDFLLFSIDHLLSKKSTKRSIKIFDYKILYI